MSKDTDADGVWRTIRGRRVFIKKGETVKTAVERSLVGDKAQTKEQHRRAMSYHANMAKRAAAAGDKAAAARHEAAVGAHAHAVDKGDKLSSMKANLRSGAAHDTRMTDEERRGSRNLTEENDMSGAERRGVIRHARQVLKQFADETDGVWRTVRGRKVFIRKGQSVQDALRDSLAGRIKSEEAGRKREKEAVDRNKSPDIDRASLIKGLKGYIGEGDKGALKFKTGADAAAARAHVGKVWTSDGYKKVRGDNVEDIYRKGDSFLVVAGGRKGSPQLYIRRPEDVQQLKKDLLEFPK